MNYPGEVDLLIVGAGLHGLAIAKTYVQVNPDAHILVVDQAESIGGSWAKERLYPGLKTNNIFGSYEFGDFPMIPERYGVKTKGHIPGAVVHAYLCDFAAHFGIDSCIRFETKVTSATLREDSKWIIGLHSIDGLKAPAKTVVANKLVIATGLTSEPHIPIFPGQGEFESLVVHSKQLKSRANELISCKEFVVLGGNKSAWDACYSAARAGSHVHMVIRPSGGGPSYLWPRKFSWGPFNLSLAILSATRLFMPFDPTPYGKRGSLAWMRYFLHETSLGQKICFYFWNKLDAHIKKLNGYNTHPELKKLEPWTTPFWMGNSLSIHNYDTNWFNLVREGKISVHVANVVSLSKRKIHLSNEEILDADALVCCTGWKSEPSIQFNLYHEGNILDIKTPLNNNDPEFLIAKREIYNDIGYLSSIPRRTENAPFIKDRYTEAPLASYKLYRMIVPYQPIFLENRNFAFIGLHSSIHAVILAQAQALWITAYFQHKVGHLNASSPNFQQVRHEAILDSVYGKLRRPNECGGAAGKYPDLVFDSLPYADVLLGDLGLDSQRKGNWWKELFETYRPCDYRGIVDEWRTRNMVR
ncbi:hypothetical protein F5884DRAFT_736448 [Xylogone sp. PMI_703]|nr:hypothetical protein F5884DRAFT_736448 [Xylogone sp. PMI_703]